MIYWALEETEIVSVPAIPEYLLIYRALDRMHKKARALVGGE